MVPGTSQADLWRFYKVCLGACLALLSGRRMGTVITGPARPGSTPPAGEQSHRGLRTRTGCQGRCAEIKVSRPTPCPDLLFRTGERASPVLETEQRVSGQTELLRFSRFFLDEREPERDWAIIVLSPPRPPLPSKRLVIRSRKASVQQNGGLFSCLQRASGSPVERTALQDSAPRRRERILRRPGSRRAARSASGA